jgi:hypothetical protein
MKFYSATPLLRPIPASIPQPEFLELSEHLWRPGWCKSKARNREIARSLHAVNERFERFRNAAIAPYPSSILNPEPYSFTEHLWRPGWCKSKAWNREIARSLHAVNERFERFRNAAIAPPRAPQKEKPGKPGFQRFYYFIISVKSPVQYLQTVHESRPPSPGFLHWVPVSSAKPLPSAPGSPACR